MSIQQRTIAAGVGFSEPEVREWATRALVEVFDNTYEGAVLVDADARILWMNDKYRALLEIDPRARVNGRAIEEVINNSRLPEVVATGRPILIDIMNIRNEPRVVSRLVLKDDTGRVIGGIGLVLYDRIQSLAPLVEKFGRLNKDLDRTRRQLAGERLAKYGFTHIIGSSRVMREIKRKARRAAEQDITVLLLGETGTGKELLAHAIHAASPRALRPMVSVNASAIPEGLMEAELFGVAPGAYTGEIGDMPLELQSKLLRVLQEKEFEPLGSDRVVRVDVRVVAATSRDLKSMVENGDFRSDLYYRLNVFPLVLPPLRERTDDIEALCEHMLEGLAMHTGRGARELSPAALDVLKRQAWPGNIRELHNLLEQAVIHVDDELITLEHLVELLPELSGPRGAVRGDACAVVRPLAEVMREAECDALRNALEACSGVRTRAAKRLGISRSQFYEKLKACSLA